MGVVIKMEDNNIENLKKYMENYNTLNDNDKKKTILLQLNNIKELCNGLNELNDETYNVDYSIVQDKYDSEDKFLYDVMLSVNEIEESLCNYVLNYDNSEINLK